MITGFPQKIRFRFCDAVALRFGFEALLVTFLATSLAPAAGRGRVGFIDGCWTSLENSWLESENQLGEKEDYLSNLPEMHFESTLYRSCDSDDTTTKSFKMMSSGLLILFFLLTGTFVA